MQRAYTLFFVLAFVALGGPAVGQSDLDKEIEEAVWEELRKDGLEGELEEVYVRDAVVILRGEPRDTMTKMRVIEAALRVETVEAVESEMQEKVVQEAPPPPPREPRPSARPEPEEPAATPAEPEAPAAAPAEPEAVSPPPPEPTPDVQRDPDKELEETVREALEKAKLDEEVAEISVKDRVVTLSGKPRNAYSKMKAIETALAVEGVEAVESNLEVAMPESAEDLAQDLVNRVLTYPHYTVFDDITFRLLEGGVVQLGGYVTMPFKKDEIEERVGKVMGVAELKSEIKVLPVSQSDDRLRRVLFERIYGNPMFTRYANMTHPPIHIIVDSSRVILTGAVANNVEKRQAESIVRSTFGVLTVESRLQVNP